jgi:hypothetical protein
MPRTISRRKNLYEVGRDVQAVEVESFRQFLQLVWFGGMGLLPHGSSMQKKDKNNETE